MRKTNLHIFTFLLAALPLTMAAGDTDVMPYNAPEDNFNTITLTKS